MDVLTKSVTRALRIGNSKDILFSALEAALTATTFSPQLEKYFQLRYERTVALPIQIICKTLDLFKESPCQTSLLPPNFLNLNPNLLFLKSLQSSPYPRASSSLKTSSSKTWLLALWCSTKTGSCSCNVAQVNAPFQTFG